mmetsp:Transcript_110547/g.165474  ORF Transcript_110547/g.165474 Transcript_110547/m.165474 type:complete len:221 (+) Transcript_110547:636-1298(+)
MHKRVLVLRHAGLDDQLDLGHVDAARRDVGGDERREGARAEVLECDLALGLVDVAVDGARGGLQLRRRRQCVHVRLRVRKHQHPPSFAVEPHDVSDHSCARGPVAGDCDVSDGGSRPLRVLPDHVDVEEVFAVLLGEFLDPGRHGGGPEVGLPRLLGDLADDGLDVVLETHLQHLIRLIQHKHFHAAHVQRALVNVVDRAPWRAHHHVHASPQSVVLGRV